MNWDWDTATISCNTGTTTTSGGAFFIPAISDSREEKYKEYTDKTDKHVDELEADIEYLNNKLKDYEVALTNCQELCNELMENYRIAMARIDMLENTVSQ